MIRPPVLALLCVIGAGGPASGSAPDGLAGRLWDITETVLDRHIAPPTRAEMVLGALKGLYRAAGIAAPAGLARRASAISVREQLGSLLDELWPPALVESLPSRDQGIRLENGLIGGTLATVPGGARLLSADDLKLEEQIAGNRYVGLQITLAMNREAKRASIAEVFEGGPADRAGLKAGELIEEIDDVTTGDLDLKKVIDRLRGAEGSTVTIRVRGPNSTASRALSIVRGALSRPTIKGFGSHADGRLDPWIPGPERIGYGKLEQILGSTPHELRALSRRLEEEGARALILDLRPLGAGQVNLHATVLLADCLLEGGTIGRVRSVDRVETFRAEPDALFRELPLFLLVDNNTPAAARWLAAALQDNRRAVVVGPARRAGFRPPGSVVSNADARSVVAVGSTTDAIEMVTGRLERGDGRSLGGAERGRNGLLVPNIEAAPVDSRDDRGPRRDPVAGDDAVLSTAVGRLRMELR